MGKLLTLILSSAALLAALSACNTTGCTENQNALPLAGLYSGQTAQPIEVDSLAIGGIGAPNDSLLYTPSQRLSVIYLPFRSSSQQCSFCIHYCRQALSSPALNDTLTFSYTSQPRFVSEDCGAMFFYRIISLQHTTHLIDSIQITDSLVTNTDLQRLKIFFRTSDTEQQQPEPAL